jgi:4-amino-4-deoxy-L-arabinose transferase-like glycosyltransferase
MLATSTFSKHLAWTRYRLRDWRATDSGQQWRPRHTVALAAVLVIWTLLTTAIAVSTPAWEANDEPDHVKNVAALASGHWYRIDKDSGFEGHQAPLYYLLLAGYEHLAGLPTRTPAPVLDWSTNRPGVFVHNTPTEARDQRLATTLRAPSIALGLLALILTAAAAWKFTSSPWSAVAAAAFVAGVPKFSFLSAVVNNDNLVNTLGALATLLVALLLGSRAEAGRRWLVLCLGIVSGALILTKLSAAPAVVALSVIGTFFVQSTDRRRLALLFWSPVLAISGWWFIQNQVRYGDPLAAKATRDHLREIFPPLLEHDAFFRQAFVNLPRGTWSSFWYSSGWNQYHWRDHVYWPLWVVLASGLLGLVWPRLRRPPQWLPLGVRSLALLALMSLSTIWVLGLQTSQTQARVAFMGLPAIATLWAMGLERWRCPVVLRFVLPLLGLAGTVVALQRDVLQVFPS